MSLVEFSKEVGVGIYYIKKQMEAGNIPYEIIPIGKNYNYYIDPAFVPEFKKIVAQRKRAKPVRRITSIKTRVTPLGRATREIGEYNRINNTNLSYGQAVAKGIIEGT